MSKFIKQITCKVIGGFKLMDKPFDPDGWAEPNITVEVEIEEFTRLMQYRIGVEFVSKFYAKNQPEADYLKHSFISEVKEVIYGDLVSHLRDLERHMFDQDREKMKSTLRDIMREVT